MTLGIFPFFAQDLIAGATGAMSPDAEAVAFRLALDFGPALISLLATLAVGVVVYFLWDPLHALFERAARRVGRVGMAAQFERLLDPLIVMITVPLPLVLLFLLAIRGRGETLPGPRMGLRWAAAGERFTKEGSLTQPDGEAIASGRLRYRFDLRSRPAWGSPVARILLVIFPPDGSTLGLCSIEGIDEALSPG